MEKYLKAMDYGRKVILALIAEGNLGSPEQVQGRWERFFDGIVEVALYDTEISQEEFAQLQACCRMSQDQYQEWRQSYGK